MIRAPGNYLLLNKVWRLFYKATLTPLVTILILNSGLAQNINEIDKILIRNVIITGQGDDSQDMNVSLLIKRKKLRMVTQDKIEMKDADIVFDARGGFVLGQLEIGSPAAFIILNQDPRTNIDVLIDTRLYALFAIANGEVTLNKLIRIDEDYDGPSGGWLSYAPPTIALPLSYQKRRKWNVIRTKPFNLVFGGAVLLENTRWLSNDPVNEDQVGELSQYEGGSIRGFRVGFVGVANFKVPWTFVFFTATNSFERGFEQGNLDEFIFFDYRVNIPIGKVNLTVGKTRETISLQRLSTMIHLPSQQERASVADALLPSRNVGIVLNSSFLQDRMTWATGIYNDWFEKDRSFSENPTVFTGRITGLPLLSDDENNLLHLGVAGRYSNAAGGIHYMSKTEIFRGPTSVDTDLIDDAQSSFHYGLEMVWRGGPFTIGGEYIQSKVSSSANNNPRFNGSYFIASYVLTGEKRAYNKQNGTFQRIHVANDLNSGGWGSWELYGRWSSINLNDQEIDGGKMNTLSFGLNWWPFEVLQFNINYRFSTLNRFEQNGHNHGLVTRLAFVLE